MKLLPAVMVVMTLAASQSAGTRLVGLWTAQFDGRTYVRLDLRSSNGVLTGSISVGSVELDKTGTPVRVGDAPQALTPIFDITLTDTTLTFARKDGSDTDRFELKLGEAGRADLRFLLTDRQRRHLATDGIPDPRPFPLTKQQ